MLTIKEKPCSACKLVLPASEFYPHRRMRSGLQSQCRTCNRQWHKANPEYVRQKGVEWRKNNPSYGRDWQRRANYGVSPEDMTALRTSQGGACAGCLTDLATTKECVDHCHISQRVRGLLCNLCNLAIGYAKDDADRLRRLAKYLEQSREEAEAYK